MRSVLTAIAAVFLLSSIGCHHNLCNNGCDGGGCSGHASAGNSGGGHIGRLPQGYLDQQGPAGPPTAAYGYPYYTTRAPRDFLVDNPPSIGP